MSEAGIDYVGGVQAYANFSNLPVDTESTEVKILREGLMSVASIGTYNIIKEPQASGSLAKTLEERLYNALAACKMRVAEVAMHLDNDWRQRFFRQLDNLLDFDEWDEDDLPVTSPSFVTLMRLLLFIYPTKRPGIGATSNGHIIASWTAGKNHLTIECLPNDKIRWVAVQYIEDERESAAGQTSIERIRDVLSAYRTDQWFVE
ncbi:MAG: hypothetical protein QM488_07385 [Rhizobiaceae bacterium]